MKAAVLDKFGPSTVMEVCDVPKPAINADQVLVEVIAAGVNPIDWKIREGWKKVPILGDIPILGKLFPVLRRVPAVKRLDTSGGPGRGPDSRLRACGRGSWKVW